MFRITPLVIFLKLLLNHKEAIFFEYCLSLIAGKEMRYAFAASWFLLAAITAAG